MAEDMLDLERFDLISNFAKIFEDMEAQKLINAAQEQIEVDQLTPVEEGVEDEVQ